VRHFHSRPTTLCVPLEDFVRCAGWFSSSRLLRACLLLALGTFLSLPAGAAGQSPPWSSWWGLTSRDLDQWSGPDGMAVSFGTLARGHYVLVVQPPERTRSYVFIPATGNYAYLDTSGIAPSPPPPAGVTAIPTPAPTPVPTPPPVPTGVPVPEEPGEPVEQATEPPPPAPPTFRPWWVAVHRPTELWSGPDGNARSFGPAPRGTHYLVMEPQNGPRLHVLNPETKNYAYIDATAVGPAGPPKAAAIEVKGWRGFIAGDVVNLRPEPHTFIRPVTQLRAGTPIVVTAWVEGEEIDKDNRTWARVAAYGDDLSYDPAAPPAGYVYSALIRAAPVREPPPVPPNAPMTGKWIDVNLTHQVVIAYEGRTPVYRAVTTSGRPGWETPTGIFRIIRRVENETMDGSTLLRLDKYEVPTYYLENVKWTQYFTTGGAALHTNYWRPAGLFGIPSSHGCLGLLERDAKWFWDWASIGTLLVIHY
jgi:hypothetical protein